MTETPGKIDGKEYERQDTDVENAEADFDVLEKSAETETNEILEKPSLVEAVKEKFQSLKQKLSPTKPTNTHAEASSQTQQICRREFGKQLGKAAVFATLILAVAGKIQEVFANETNPYYNHGVNEELSRLSRDYRIHDFPAKHIQQILKDMTEEKDVKARKNQKEMLEKYLKQNSQNWKVQRDPWNGLPRRVGSSRALHIEGNDDDNVVFTQFQDETRMLVGYYPDANNNELTGYLYISDNEYEREYRGVREKIENPGTMLEEVTQLRELLLDDNFERPAVEETRAMIEAMTNIEAQPFPILEGIRKLPQKEQKPLFAEMKTKVQEIIHKTPDLEGFKSSGMNIPEQTSILIYHPVNKFYSRFILQPTEKFITYGSHSSPHEEDATDNYSLAIVIDKMKRVTG